MTDHTGRSTEALLARRAIAEQATPGPWFLQYNAEIPAGVLSKIGYVSSNIGYEDAAHIAANDPTTVAADIDEILRLRAEVEQLRHAVEGYKASAAAAWGGEIPSPLYGHKAPTEEDMVAMFAHLNCSWCGGSGHVGDCDEADQRVKANLERLEKEADWLATAAANGGWHGVRVSPDQMREDARKAVEEEACPKN